MSNAHVASCRLQLDNPSLMLISGHAVGQSRGPPAPPPSHDSLPQGNRDVPPPEGTSHGCNGCNGCIKDLYDTFLDQGSRSERYLQIKDQSTF